MILLIVALGSCKYRMDITLALFISWLDKFDKKLEIKIVSSQVDIVLKILPREDLGLNLLSLESKTQGIILDCFSQIQTQC